MAVPASELRSTPSWLARLRVLVAGGAIEHDPVPMPDRPLNVLVLCTGNSARSILGEALLNHLGHARVRGHSAGSRPAGRVDPLALRVLAENGIPTRTFYSKSWDEFARPGAVLDIVITVCDAAAEETCPWWPGAPMRAHWGLPDPAAVHGTEGERLQAFRETYATLRTRIERLIALIDRRPDRETFKAELYRIHTTDG